MSEIAQTDIWDLNLIIFLSYAIQHDKERRVETPHDLGNYVDT